MSSARRHWLTPNEHDLKDRLAVETRTRREQHIATYGPHVCTPDTTNPWSTCHLETQK